MTAPATLSRERIEELAMWFESRHGDQHKEIALALLENLRLREQVEALKEYVDFLNEELEKTSVTMHVHGHRTPKWIIEKGEELRARIGRTASGEWSDEGKGGSE